MIEGSKKGVAGDKESFLRDPFASLYVISRRRKHVIYNPASHRDGNAMALSLVDEKKRDCEPRVTRNANNRSSAFYVHMCTVICMLEIYRHMYKLRYIYIYRGTNVAGRKFGKNREKGCLRGSLD